MGPHTTTHSSCVAEVQLHLAHRMTECRRGVNSAVHIGRMDLLACMIQRDLDLVNIPDSDGKTLLHYSCANGSQECVHYLINNKVHTADVHCLYLHTADVHCSYSHRQVKETRHCFMFLQADLNAMDHRKWTPLMCAVSVQCVEIVRFLLSRGASCNQTVKTNFCK